MRVFSNSAMSLDGKLATRFKEHVAIGSSDDRLLMSKLRSEADAVLVGGSTWRNWPLPLIEENSIRKTPIINAVLTETGSGPRSGRFFENPLTLPVILGGPQADLDGFPNTTITIRSIGESDIVWALSELEQRFGVKNLLIEAGGELIFQLLQNNLLDELYVTVCPKIIGGRDAPSLVGGKGFSVDEISILELLSYVRLNDEIYLHYRVQPRR